MDDRHFYTHLAAAYVRGKRPDFSHLSDADAVAEGADAGLRLHRFKRTATLPRVRKVIGALRGFAPAHLIDIGSGRGAFLWPLLDALPHVRVTAVDRLDYRVNDIRAVALGGVERLSCARMDVGALGFRDDAAGVVTILEVLEHLEDPLSAARQVVRVAERAVIASVPSREDDNPEHIQLFDEHTLTTLFMQAGAARVSVEYVLNHMIAVATVNA